MSRRAIFALALLVGVGTAQAQCPDGSPPPCRTRPTAGPALPVRRADPPLDANTWIVLPFDNLAKNAEVDWLRDASVNLLYLDLSKWRDIKVVDDERVADLLREVPEAQSGKALSLSAGLAVAKRAGAGKLVMGDILRIGSKTTVTAKVFDVKGGQRIRTTNQEATVQDSLMPAFGKLARGILNVAPPEGANVGTIGTSNTAAYQDYLEGVKALNQFDLKAARVHFDAALQQDSTFALAHYKLAVLIGWENPSDEGKVEHSKAAARYGAVLPPRERTLVTGLLAFNNLEFGRACAAYRSLIGPDSSDVEALYGTGECLFHDNIVEPIAGDTTRLQYRGSWNSAIKVFRRALAVDPSYHLAFQHILDSYTQDGRAGCRPRDPSALHTDQSSQACIDLYATVVRRAGDSLLMVPVPSRNAASLVALSAEARKTNARHANILKAREIANEWVASGPSEPRPLATLARIDLLLGNVEQADKTLSEVPVAKLDDVEGGRALLARLEIDWKLGRATTVGRVIDSLSRGSRPLAQAPGLIAVASASLGRVTALDSIARVQLSRAPPVMSDYFRHAVDVVLGATPASAVAEERTVFDTIAHSSLVTGGPRNATAQIGTTLVFGLRLPRPEWPRIDSIPDPRLGPVLALARKDTVALRVAAIKLDSIARAAADSTVPDDGSAVIAADAYLILGDSAAALAVVRTFLDRGIRATPMFTPLGGGFAYSSHLWPRMLLLRGDLEAARGSKDEARKAYRSFLGFWSRVDPQFQPMVDHAKAALTALGPG